MCQAPVSRPAGNLNLIFADVNTTPFPLMDVWPRAVVLVLNVVESQTLFPAPSSLPNFRVALKSPSESAGKGVFFLDKNLSWMSHNQEYFCFQVARLSDSDWRTVRNCGFEYWFVDSARSTARS
jgi:hypothetical protein